MVTVFALCAKIFPDALMKHEYIIILYQIIISDNLKIRIEVDIFLMVPILCDDKLSTALGCQTIVFSFDHLASAII